MVIQGIISSATNKILFTATILSERAEAKLIQAKAKIQVIININESDIFITVLFCESVNIF